MLETTDLLNPEEFLDLALELEHHHAVFYQLWEMGRPKFTDSIKTAAVAFDEQGKWVEFKFNPKFWKRLTPYQRKFVICHECLHIILNHGVRFIDSHNRDAANVTMDIVVNESLVRSFGFDRAQLGDIDKDGCWADTVFPGQDIGTDGAFEFYYNQLPQHKIKLSSLDDHSGLGGSDWGEAIEGLNRSLTPEEKQALKDLIDKHFQSDDPDQQGGHGTGGVWTFVNTGEVKRKKKWETVIKRWSRKYDRPELRDIEQWARVNRRFVFLSNDLMLPTEMEQEYEIEGKIQVWFFQDTSGSCWHLKERFFRAAESLSPERFDVRLFCFDTTVKETSLAKKQVYGGGGTYFNIIEDKIQKTIHAEGTGYPEAVFVITDGYGNRVSPQQPEKWYWFLSSNCKTYIPAQSQVYYLRDFE